MSCKYIVLLHWHLSLVTCAQELWFLWYMQLFFFLSTAPSLFSYLFSQRRVPSFSPTHRTLLPTSLTDNSFNQSASLSAGKSLGEGVREKIEGREWERERDLAWPSTQNRETWDIHVKTVWRSERLVPCKREWKDGWGEVSDCSCDGLDSFGVAVYLYHKFKVPEATNRRLRQKLKRNNIKTNCFWLNRHITVKANDHLLQLYSSITAHFNSMIKDMQFIQASDICE